MSSSVFIESCTKAFKGGIGSENDVAISGSPDSNLVVVYGKNGVNFDKRGIENLIEEKTLSSISVIRLGSPTPSMLDEEEEAEKAEELLRRQAEGLSDNESANSSNNGSSIEEAEYSESEDVPTGDDEKSDADGENSADNGKLEHHKKKLKSRRKIRSTAKTQITQSKKHKERPDIIGLTVEQFYPGITAKEVVKEALKLAGVSTFKKTADYEFQMYVIKNDHCYTPFTSPAQMKAKLAEKYKAEKLAGRRIIPHTAVTMKQLQLKKKVMEGLNDHLDQPSLNSNKDQHMKMLNKPAKFNKQAERDELLDCEADIHSSTAESDFDVLSEESGDTDNDRDSDLDFNVNNRKGRKKKDLVTKAKRLSAGKVCVKRIITTQDDGDDQRNKSSRPIINNLVNRPTKIGTITKPGGCAPIAVQKLLSDAVAALPPIPKRPATVQIEEKVVHPAGRPHTIPSAIRRGPTIEIHHGIQKTPIGRTHLQASPQSVKEIVINKVMASPKGGFTELGELLSQTEAKASSITPITPTSSNKAPIKQVKIPSPSKGFMPLGIETAAKNKLPIQISIQTHQSSSELAKSRITMESLPPVQQNDTTRNESPTQYTEKEPSSSDLASEHFDLIDSIVNDEMQNNSLMEVTSKSNENIPKLVKMLENAEQSLESNTTNPQIEKQLSNFASSADGNVDDIDISNAPLLESSDGVEIPDDLLQQVVDLIEDDETLQEAVKKQVFGGEQNEEDTCIESGEAVNAVPTTTASLQLTTAHISTSLQEPNQGKSIIEMTISNVPSTPVGTSGTGGDMSVFATNVPTTQPMPSPTIRKEPIKIVRGNGRVITLPPIEAPTTRAKRRAQNQPASTASSSTIFNESSLDSSLQSNSSFTTIEHVPPPAGAVEKKTEAVSKRRVSKESATSATTASKAKRAGASTKKNTAAKNAVNKSAAEEEASGSQEDDDDPNRLWCICRQPHNNRFMICCDVCEDWFHGTCVSITKAMGIEMEQKGIDWTCPKCVKLQEEKKQRKITDMLIPRKVNSDDAIQKQEHVEIGAKEDVNNLDGTITDSSFDNLLDITHTTDTQKLQLEDVTPVKTTLKKVTKTTASMLKKKPTPLNVKPKEVNTSLSQTRRRLPVSQQSIKQQVALCATSPQQTFKELQKSMPVEPISTEPQTCCIVCKKVARPNSIYCSDDCIRKHAQNALNMFAAVSTAKSPEPTVAANTNEDAAVKKKKAKGLFEDILSMADRKPKIERVHVIERRSGRVLTGSNAPTTHNLKKWLQDNQTFEVVQPGSIQAQEIEKKQKHRQTQSLSPIVITTASKHITHTPANTHMQITQSPHGMSTVVVKAATSQREAESNVQVQKPVKQLIEQVVRAAPNSPRPGTPKQLQKYPQQVSIKPDKATRNDAKEEIKERKEKPKQRPIAETVTKRQSDIAPAVSTNSEPIRLNVRRTLKEQLLLRMNETGSENDNCGGTGGTLPKLSIEAIDKFVQETEAEMYDYFSRDTGSRYRAKYRSLMFNIKDRKNRTLFAKICANKIQPKQLVRMSPEELASQELAQWRENEAKHQLEMIKKSELDLLSCAKNYVLKTHKGEEVIEGKLEDCVNLDASIPVEDVVSVLNNSVVSSSSASDIIKADLEPNSSIDQQHSHEIQGTKGVSHVDEEKQKSHSKEKERERGRECERDRNREHGRDREYTHARARSHDSDHSRERQRKNKDRHRDKSRSRKRSRSHSRSRSQSREKRHKSYHKDEKREREEREREKDKYKEKERERERERERDRDARQQKDEYDNKSLEKVAMSNSPITVNSNKSSKDKSSSKKPNTSKSVEVYSLIDQILESTKTVEEAANLISEKEKLKEKDKHKREVIRQTATPPLPTSSAIKISTEHKQSTSSAHTNDDQEPTSTVTIATPPQDPYIRYTDIDSPTLSGNSASALIWSGNINMVDVASFQIVLQPVIGNSLNLGSLLPGELDVVGRIGPETVWEYISKIKRSPNKEIVIIRLIPGTEMETAAYTVLFQYLENRNRLGVINSVSPQIKDFYIYPLGAGKPMPQVLLPQEKVDFYEDPYRPDILVGVVVRIIGKRHATPSNSAASTSTSKSHRRGVDTDTFTPPGSPKRKRRIHASTPKVDEIDVDAIIKAPIITKSHKSSLPPTTITDDDDEPYSPGGSSDDDALITSKMPTRSDEDDLKRKMDELNRQIAAQEKEIAGLLNVESSCFASTSATKTSAVLANISIPSNLSQILASIKSKPDNNQTHFSPTTLQSQSTLIQTVRKTHSNMHDEEEYNPELVTFDTSAKPAEKPSSRLAQLSEAELLSMVPDGMIDTPPPQKSHSSCTDLKSSHYEEPPPPGV